MSILFSHGSHFRSGWSVTHSCALSPDCPCSLSLSHTLTHTRAHTHTHTHSLMFLQYLICFELAGCKFAAPLLCRASKCTVCLLPSISFSSKCSKHKCSLCTACTLRIPPPSTGLVMLSTSEPDRLQRVRLPPHCVFSLLCHSVSHPAPKVHTLTNDTPLSFHSFSFASPDPSSASLLEPCRK